MGRETPGSARHQEVAEPVNSESHRSRRRLPARADVLAVVGKVLWPVRGAREQHEAGRASAENAVHLAQVRKVFRSDKPAEEADDRGEAAAEAGAAESTGREETPRGDTAPTSTSTPSTPSDSSTPSTPTSDEHEGPFVPDPEAAAFFDVDNTLVQGASILLLARGLAKHKFFTTRDVIGMAWTQIKFRVSGTENADDVAEGREKALGFVKGRKVSEVVELSEEIFDASMIDRIWPGTRALAQMHLDAGQQVWLVTATPVELARVIAQRLGLSGALGTVAENAGGVYTGKLVGDILHGEGKAHAVQALAESQGFDLSKCYAYSDSHNDVPMLSLVGHAVAINPDSRLRQVARDRGWEVKDFRTVRKAAKKAFPGVIAVGAVGGATAAARSERGNELLRGARRRLR